VSGATGDTRHHLEDRMLEQARRMRRRPRRLIPWLLVALAAGAGCREAAGGEARVAVTGGNADRGKAAIATYGCGSCHTIPGIRSAKGMVGPPLLYWSRRTFIAGEVPNTPDFLIRWIEVPQAIEPGTAMPNLGVPEGDARDIAAYLYTLR
jgi:cytochrome c